MANGAKKKGQIMSSEELSSFCDQIALMLSSGMTLRDGIEMLAEDEMKGNDKVHPYTDLYKIVDETGSLYVAMKENEDSWPQYMIEMVGIGEQTGRLEDIMISLSTYYQREGRIRTAAMSAITYPLVLGVMMVVIIGILLMILGCYPLFIFLVCRENPYPILWKLREPILTAFVTRSSAAALPVSLRTAQEKMHVRKELAGFTLSLGATVNMDGVCLHLPVFAVLAANLFGFSLEPSQIFLLVLSVVFASVGAGGVPGGSIFLLFMVLDCLKLSPEQSATIVALALGINPLLDMFETACNVAGDNVGTYIISKRLKMIDAPPGKE